MFILNKFDDICSYVLPYRNQFCLNRAQCLPAFVMLFSHFYLYFFAMKMAGKTKENGKMAEQKLGTRKKLKNELKQEIRIFNCTSPSLANQNKK